MQTSVGSLSKKSKNFIVSETNPRVFDVYTSEAETEMRLTKCKLVNMVLLAIILTTEGKDQP